MAKTWFVPQTQITPEDFSHAATKKTDKILDLEITLKESNPKIWRRVLVPADFNFDKLHSIIQISMGWKDRHLHQFIVGQRGRRIGIPFEGDFGDMEIEDGRTVKISAFLNSPNDKITYEYDFGDSWEHLVEVKEVLEPEDGEKYPLVTDGAMACPPEDCGGVAAYTNLVETMQKKGTKAYKEMRKRLGGRDLDPAAFDPGIANRNFFKEL